VKALLVIDGSARVRARLAERLGVAFAVEEAADLRSALTTIAASPPDVVVIDVHLDADTGLPGIVLLRKELPRACIVVLTNEANDVHRRECLLHGADFFLDKSREFDRIAELVRARARTVTGAP
jgi:two-component system, NarL family, response regulator DevR